MDVLDSTLDLSEAGGEQMLDVGSGQILFGDPGNMSSTLDLSRSVNNAGFVVGDYVEILEQELLFSLD